jgi:hypothetical protein
MYPVNWSEEMIENHEAQHFDNRGLHDLVLADLISRDAIDPAADLPADHVMCDCEECHDLDIRQEDGEAPWSDYEPDEFVEPPF